MSLLLKAVSKHLLSPIFFSLTYRLWSSIVIGNEKMNYFFFASFYRHIEITAETILIKNDLVYKKVLMSKYRKIIFQCEYQNYIKNKYFFQIFEVLCSERLPLKARKFSSKWESSTKTPIFRFKKLFNQIGLLEFIDNNLFKRQQLENYAFQSFDIYRHFYLE